MNICIIGTAGIPASYGGFETLAERLVDTNESKFTVYCSKNHYQEFPKKYKNADLVYIPFDANGVSSIIYDLLSMLHALVSGHKNFLVLGVSGALFFPILGCFPNVKIITNYDRGSYGRILAHIEINQINISDLLINKNLGVRYDRNNKKDWCIK
jgi:hypothetical protein